jgi:hypothetical protein
MSARAVRQAGSLRHLDRDERSLLSIYLSIYQYIYISIDLSLFIYLTT